MILYRILNTRNGKMYIGLTAVGIERRWREHVRDARDGSQRALHRAMRRYGIEAFAAEEVMSLLPGRTVEDLHMLEREMIAQEGTMVPNGYNITSGGEGFAGYENPALQGRPLSETHKAKLRAAWTLERREANARRAKEQFAAYSGQRAGTKASAETRAKQSAAQKARFERDGKPTNLTPEALRAAWTEERRIATRERTIAANKARAGKPLSEARKAQIAATHPKALAAAIAYRRGLSQKEIH